jgi:hypothetical protein
MEKKIYFLFIVSFLIIIFGGIFLWLELSKQIDKGSFFPGVRFEPPENYQFVETDQGIIVRNENVGLTFSVPEGWNADKVRIGPEQWIINVNSPDLEADERGFLLRGCGISTWIEHDEVTSNIIRYRIQDPERFSQELSAGEYQSIEINGHPASRMILERPEWGQTIAIKIPIEDRIYVFDTRILPEEGKGCLNAFNNFLESVFIETIIF